MTVVSGELIRMMNYVDDIAATLRRITVHYSSLTPEEKTRLADYMEKAEPNYANVLQDLRSGKTGVA
jgi:hypothetical protein